MITTDEKNVESTVVMSMRPTSFNMMINIETGQIYLAAMSDHQQEISNKEACLSSKTSNVTPWSL